MGISLAKGGNVNLTQGNAGLREVAVGLGWDARATDGTDFDLDASAFLLGANGKVADDSHFVFYNQLSFPAGTLKNGANPDGVVRHQGDNLTGDGDGDDEVIEVDIQRVPEYVQKISFAVSIHDAVQRRQAFGMVDNAYIRVVNKADGRELARYDLTEDGSTETAMIFGELYRHNGDWKFRAIGQGFAGGFAPLVVHYGVNIA
jgi:tellurium resistance protein TerD